MKRSAAWLLLLALTLPLFSACADGGGDDEGDSLEKIYREHRADCDEMRGGGVDNQLYIYALQIVVFPDNQGGDTDGYDYSDCQTEAVPEFKH